MWQYNDSQELRHYGVVGMKWVIVTGKQVLQSGDKWG